MAYTPITKLDKFNGEEDNAYVWLNDVAKAITANNWNDARYFSNNNSINKLANTFTTIKQGDTEAILNQFIRGLHSSILQQVRPMHLVDFPTTVTYARDFEAAELKANYT
ncbi:hypothetical protein G9A89_012415 [Geosiphon pyriformis]|nr:hypothetical protein G9A89_012415 [Geosiphon pyriformis]